MRESERHAARPREHLDVVVRRSNRLMTGVVAFCVSLFALWAVLLQGAPAFLTRRLGGITVGLLVYLVVLVACFLVCCWYARRRRRHIEPQIALLGKEELHG